MFRRNDQRESETNRNNQNTNHNNNNRESHYNKYTNSSSSRGYNSRAYNSSNHNYGGYNSYRFGHRSPAKVEQKGKNHYEILGLSTNATNNEIKKMYHKLALTHHPDKTNNKLLSELFKEITAAYTVLSDTEQKTDYDKTLRSNNGYGNYHEV